MQDENEVAESEKVPYDSGNQKHVDERKAASGRRAKRLKDAYKALLSHAHGRELLWDLLTMCGTFQDDFSADPVVMAGNAKCRNVGLALRRVLLKADTKMYLKMEEEFAND